ncbi:MAG: hypothetical protein F6K56_07120 [Moorea sp. SIO3G5]|nr:hypothetical protein [Moorena sp. SIO3G5]
MNRSGVGILPARKYIETGKMPVPRLMPVTDLIPVPHLIPVPPRCPFHKTIQIIPLLSNAQ